MRSRGARDRRAPDRARRGSGAPRGRRRCAATSCSCPRAEARPLDEGEFWVDDLVGCEVVDGGGRSAWCGGWSLPSCDALEVERPAGADLLVPLVARRHSQRRRRRRRIDVDMAFLASGRMRACTSTSSRSSPSGSTGSASSGTSRNALAAGHELRRSTYRDTRRCGGQVDDTPYGGGAGMVLRVDVVDAGAAGVLRGRPGGPAARAAGRRADARRAAARRRARRTSSPAEPALTLLCGRYEGIDERVLEHFCRDAVSIGRYVLSGGELAAMVVVRRRPAQAPGRARGRATARSRSRSARRSAASEYPHYTRPADVSRLERARRAALRPPRARSAAGGASAAASAAPRRAAERSPAAPRPGVHRRSKAAPLS